MKGKIIYLLGKVKKWIVKHKKTTIFFILVILGIIAFFIIRAKIMSNQNTATTQTLQTTTLEKRDLSNSVSVTGTIASADSRNVSADVNDVEIKEVKVEVGDYVNAGDVIVVLDSGSLEEDLQTAEEEYTLAAEKSNKSVSDAADSITDAQETYNDGVDDQAALVADAKSEYNIAASTEADKEEAYETAQAATKKAKEAYEDLKDQKTALKKAKTEADAAYKKAQAALEEATNAYETAQATAKDENGNVDAAVYDTYTQAQADCEKAKSDAEKAESEYNRIAEAKSAYEAAKTAEAEAKTAYEAASTQTSNKLSTYNNAVESQEDTNQKNADNIEESQYNYNITTTENASSLKSQKSQVQDIEEKLGECVVTSPISGVITAIDVEEGDTYSGEDLFTVQDMTQFVVDASVDEYDISDISKDMAAVIKTDATDDEELSGTVTYVAPTPDSSSSSSDQGGGSSSSSSSSSYSIQITLEDTDDRLRIGMTAKTSIVLESAEDVFAVPYDCVETDAEGNSYITVIDNSSFENARGNSDSANSQNQDNAAVSENSMNKPETSGEDSNSGETPSGEMPSGEMPSGEMPSGEMPDRSNSENQSDSEQNTKQIYVETGLESDYYVEIISDELSEGMQIVTTTAVSTSSDSESNDTGFSLGNLTGGSQSGGPSGGAPSGGPSGGAPGGRN